MANDKRKYDFLNDRARDNSTRTRSALDALIQAERTSALVADAKAQAGVGVQHRGPAVAQPDGLPPGTRHVEPTLGAPRPASPNNSGLRGEDRISIIMRELEMGLRSLQHPQLPHGIAMVVDRRTLATDPQARVVTVTLTDHTTEPPLLYRHDIDLDEVQQRVNGPYRSMSARLPPTIVLGETDLLPLVGALNTLDALAKRLDTTGMSVATQRTVKESYERVAAVHQKLLDAYGDHLRSSTEATVSMRQGTVLEQVNDLLRTTNTPAEPVDDLADVPSLLDDVLHRAT
jgi:hypothetical protein